MNLVFMLQQTDPTALLSAKLILAVVCVIVASSLAMGVCIGLMRRIQTIAGPERVSPPPSNADAVDADPPRDH